MKQSAYLLLIMAFLMSCLLSCSGGHTQNQEKIRKQNAQAEYIRRRSCEKVYPEPTLEIVQREPYPWEKEEKRTVTSQH